MHLHTYIRIVVRPRGNNYHLHSARPLPRHPRTARPFILNSYTHPFLGNVHTSAEWSCRNLSNVPCWFEKDAPVVSYVCDSWCGQHPTWQMYQPLISRGVDVQRIWFVVELNTQFSPFRVSPAKRVNIVFLDTEEINWKPQNIALFAFKRVKTAVWNGDNTGYSTLKELRKTGHLSMRHID
jgi:hypothetical protein